ncbi:MAG: hypothetical protein J6B56_06190 [Clostridia bacterium]|nr:hypothetical protein [Clostridia bacterium]
MKIDIISYSDTQYSALTEEQIQEVKAAQLKKNRLEIALAEAKRKEKHRLISRGIFLSGIWEAYCQKLQAEHDQEIENLRDSLLFYLRFSTKSDAYGTGYTVDYDLSVDERLAIVRQYYQTTYADANERFEAFKADKIAVVYLEELYAPLYDYFLEETK